MATVSILEREVIPLGLWGSWITATLTVPLAPYSASEQDLDLHMKSDQNTKPLLTGSLHRENSEATCAQLLSTPQSDRHMPVPQGESSQRWG